MILSEEQLWELIEMADWKSDHDCDRIQQMYLKLPDDEHTQLDEFVGDKCAKLYVKYKKDWLGNPGIDVSDDGWSDLRAEVVGRGKKFYEEINVKKLRKMADENDYFENFQYGLHK